MKKKLGTRTKYPELYKLKAGQKLTYKDGDFASIRNSIYAANYRYDLKIKSALIGYELIVFRLQ